MFYTNNNSLRIVYRLLWKDYTQFNFPTERSIRNKAQKFYESWNIGDKVSRDYPRGVRSAENFAGEESTIMKFDKNKAEQMCQDVSRICKINTKEEPIE